MGYEGLTTLQRAKERSNELVRLKRGYIKEFGETFGSLLFYIEQFGVDCRQVWVAALCRELHFYELQPENQALFQKVLARSLMVLKRNEFSSFNSSSEPVVPDQE